MEEYRLFDELCSYDIEVLHIGSTPFGFAIGVRIVMIMIRPANLNGHHIDFWNRTKGNLLKDQSLSAFPCSSAAHA